MTSSPPPRKRLRQTDLRSFLKPARPTLQHIDYAQHPLIIQHILSYVPRKQLIGMRRVSRNVRDIVDRLLRDHLVLNPGHTLQSIDGRLPDFVWGQGKYVLGKRPCRCGCNLPGKEEHDRVRDALRLAFVIDLRYLTDKNLTVLKRFLGDRCVPVVRMWMWCNSPRPGRPFPITASCVIAFGWAGSWEPSNGYRRERFELPPHGIRKAVFNLRVSNTKVPFLFDGLFMKRTPPASLEQVVFVFHSSFASDGQSAALQSLQLALPRIVQLPAEARRRRPKITFVNSDAMLPGTFPLGESGGRFAECATFQDYASAVYTAAQSEEEFLDNVSFMTLDEYRATVGPDQFRVETLG